MISHQYNIMWLRSRLTVRAGAWSECELTWVGEAETGVAGRAGPLLDGSFCPKACCHRRAETAVLPWLLSLLSENPVHGPFRWLDFEVDGPRRRAESICLAPRIHRGCIRLCCAGGMIGRSGAEPRQSNDVLPVTQPDREAAVQTLQRAAGDGRLPLQEFSERVGTALTAETQDQL